ncbi:MAG: hypothetical protein ACRCU5_12055 [Rhizobiaceae bacterium]
MLSRQDIDAAVIRNIITADQRDALLELSQAKHVAITSSETPDEQLRLIGGGNDIFVTIGILLLMAGGSFALGPLLGGQTSVMTGIAAIVILAIAEIVTRQKRMRLSSTVLALLFMACTATFVWLGASTQIDVNALQNNPLAIFSLRGPAGWISLVGALVIMFGAGWQRIRHLVVGSTLPTSVLKRLPPIQL